MEPLRTANSAPEPPPVIAPPTVAGPIPTRRSAWPTVLGVISIVLGALGAVGGLWGILSVFVLPVIFESMNQNAGANPATLVQEFSGINIALGAATLIVAVLLLISGIGLVNRRRYGVKLANWWAALKILLGVGGVFIQVRIQQHVLGQQATAGNPPPPGMANAMIAFSVVFGLAWAWAYPVFMLIWLNLSKIKAETAAWR